MHDDCFNKCWSNDVNKSKHFLVHIHNVKVVNYYFNTRNVTVVEK